MKDSVGSICLLPPKHRKFTLTGTACRVRQNRNDSKRSLLSLEDNASFANIGKESFGVIKNCSSYSGPLLVLSVRNILLAAELSSGQIVWTDPSTHRRTVVQVKRINSRR